MNQLSEIVDEHQFVINLFISELLRLKNSLT